MQRIQCKIQIRQVYMTDLIQFLLEGGKQIQLSLHVIYFLCRIFSSVCFQWIVLIQYCCSCVFESKYVTLETPIKGDTNVWSSSWDLVITKHRKGLLTRNYGFLWLKSFEYLWLNTKWKHNSSMTRKTWIKVPL